jgi:hypothetical protein
MWRRVLQMGCQYQYHLAASFRTQYISHGLDLLYGVYLLILVIVKSARGMLETWLGVVGVGLGLGLGSIKNVKHTSG